MDTSKPSPVRTVALVILISLGAGGLVTATHEFSKDRIARNARQRTLENLQTVLAPGLDAGALTTVELSVSDELLDRGEPVSVFVMFAGHEPEAVVFATVAPDGYNAPIRMLVGLSPGGRLSGVRIIDHRETPGLGDAIESDKSDWAMQFIDKSIDEPTENGWRVDKDGGVFDSLTGATVTPRAVVKAVRGTLVFFDANATQLFARADRALEKETHVD